MYDNEIYSNSDSGKYTEYRTDGNVYSGGDINKKEKKKIGLDCLQGAVSTP